MAFSTDYSWIAVCEALEVFTLSLVWVTAMLYFRHLVPRKYTATGQALPVIAHFCIGESSHFKNFTRMRSYKHMIYTTLPNSLPTYTYLHNQQII